MMLSRQVFGFKRAFGKRLGQLFLALIIDILLHKEDAVKGVFGLTAGILFVVGYTPYILAILRGETTPEKATWIIWASLDTIILAGMFAEGALNGQMIGVVLGVWIVVVLSLKYGEPGWSGIDKFCLGGAMLGIVLWQMFDSPTLGVVTSLTVAVIGSIPTFASAWRDPCRENKLGWTLWWISSVCAVVAIPHWTLVDATQPIVFLGVQSVMMYLLYAHPFYLAKTSETAA